MSVVCERCGQAHFRGTRRYTVLIEGSMRLDARLCDVCIHELLDDAARVDRLLAVRRSGPRG